MTPGTLLNFLPRYYEGGPVRWHLPLLFDLVRSHQPRRALVLGFGDGDAVFALCQAAVENRTGTRVIALHRLGGEEAVHDQAWQKGETYAEQFYPDHLALRAGTSSDLPPELNGLDLVLLDDCDSGRQLLQEWSQVRPRLQPGALVLVHGLAVERQDSPRQAWREIASGGHHHEFTDGIGLGLTVLPNVLGSPGESAEARLSAHTASARLYRALALRIDSEIRATRLTRRNAVLEARQIWLDSLREHWWRAQEIMDYQADKIRQTEDRFGVLETDRAKAQEIMEYQARQLQELGEKVEIATTRLKSLKTKNAALHSKRRPLWVRVGREIRRALRRLGKDGNGPPPAQP